MVFSKPQGTLYVAEGATYALGFTEMHWFLRVLGTNNRRLLWNVFNRFDH